VRPAKPRSKTTIRSAGACFWRMILSAFSLAIAPETDSQAWRMRLPVWRSSAFVSRRYSGPGKRWPWWTVSAAAATTAVSSRSASLCPNP
jgi:hypothetical protein